MADPHPLKVAFARNHPEELAAWLAAQPHEALLEALGELPADACGGVAARLPHTAGDRLIAAQSDETVAGWVAHATLDTALTLLLRIETSRRPSILRTLPDRRMRRALERAVIYPRKTVGALLDPTAVRIAASTTLEEAIELLRVGDYTSREWIWIVDGEGRYEGLLDVRRALLARSDRYRVGELAIRLEPLRAETALTAARDLDEWMKHPELPVVDHRGHLLGTLSRERLIEALRREEPSEHGVVDGVVSLTNQYFRVMRACLGDLLGARELR